MLLWRDAEIENMTSLQQFILGRSGDMFSSQPPFRNFVSFQCSGVQSCTF